MTPIAAAAPRAPIGSVLAAVVASVITAATLLRFGSDLVGVGPTLVDSRGVPAWLRLLTAAAGAGGVAATWRTANRAPVSTGFAILLAGWLLPGWADSTLLAPRVRVVVSCAGPLVAAGIALIALTWRRSATRTARFAVAIVAALSVAATLVAALGVNPFDDPHCHQVCRDVPAPLSRLLSTPHAQAVSGGLALFACAVLLVALPSVRPRYLPIAAASASVSVVLGAARSITSNANLGLVEPALAASGAGALATAVLTARASLRRSRQAVERLAADLTTGSIAEGVRFALPGATGWIDAAGRPITPIPGERKLTLHDDDGPSIQFAVRSTPFDDEPRRMSGATRLALENARLAALGRARARSIQESQQRIIAAFDEERRRIERDLHDGAQQRLVSVAFQLSAARSPLAEAALAGAEADVLQALEALRGLAHGLFPSALATNEGITAAMEDLAAASDIAVTLHVETIEPIAPQVATAIYAVASHALSRSRSTADIRLSRDADTVRIRAHADHATADTGGAFTDVRDRVGASGGCLELRSARPGELDVEAVFPCVSS